MDLATVWGMTRGEMIKAAREARDWSQADLAKKTGVTQQAIQKIETGETKKSRYERDLMDFLEIGEEVPIVGYVGAGSEAHFYANGQGPFGMVPAPEHSTPSTVAVEIHGESLGPLLDRWIVYYDRIERPVTEDMFGRLCVVGLADDRVLVKQIKPSRTKGLYHLFSNTTEVPILDVPILWAARVKNIMPRG